ncbi:potassium transporter [Williamsia sp. 1138]|uniref:Cation:proton antiporter n=1 Tax=Gordonia rubripertincta TaxID=36822 RepID=A0ABT4MZS1_GORRU|nr:MULTISPECIES: cation:proton antiporter [Mycobacteriales]MCZ4552513.1 cation:proton antiporter [Gordonia rubripertincta]OZG29910.1 potassium transporter [Williamsia sp. 1138]
MSVDVAQSLFWIVLAAAFAPILASTVPKRLVPEVVVLLVAGIVIGPFGFGIAEFSPGIDMLQELGLGLLFLLAGYELDQRELVGSGGRRAFITWICCLAIAFGATFGLAQVMTIRAEVATAIALTSTAIGTLLPILAERGLIETRLGKTILNHGAVGELCPVLAMAILLGVRDPAGSLLVLVVFGLAAVVVAMLPGRIGKPDSRLAGTIRRGADTTSQTQVRLTVLLLVGLVTLAATFQIDIIIGAFAAGFILRRTLPRGHEGLETKLAGLAFGLLIPVFFVTSGMNIDVESVLNRPLLLVLAIVMLLLVRGLPVFISTRFEKVDGARAFTVRQRTQIALYSTTGLPLIVAVTTVAVDAGPMTPSNASILVAAGAITVLILPLTATLLGRGEVEEPLPAER